MTRRHHHGARTHTCASARARTCIQRQSRWSWLCPVYCFLMYTTLMVLYDHYTSPSPSLSLSSPLSSLRSSPLSSSLPSHYHSFLVEGHIAMHNTVQSVHVLRSKAHNNQTQTQARQKALTEEGVSLYKPPFPLERTGKASLHDIRAIARLKALAQSKIERRTHFGRYFHFDAAAADGRVPLPRPVIDVKMNRRHHLDYNYTEDDFRPKEWTHEWGSFETCTSHTRMRHEGKKKKKKKGGKGV